MPAESSSDGPTEAVYAAWRADSARLVGALTRMTRDVALAVISQALGFAGTPVVARALPRRDEGPLPR